MSVGNQLGTNVKIADDHSGVKHTNYCVGNFKKPGFVTDTEKDKVIKKIEQPGLIISDGQYIHRLLGKFVTE